MTNWEMFGEGMKLIIFGMGFVFVFLITMILLMRVLQAVVRPFEGIFPEPAAAPVKKKAASGDDAQLAAVAATAVELYRRGGK